MATSNHAGKALWNKSQSESQPDLHTNQPATKNRQYGGLGAISNGSQLLPDVHNL